MISVKNVSKWFGSVRAVQEVSLEIPTGQIVGLLGPNGAGKTTTLRMITGYLPPSLGAVTVCGFDSVTQSMDARRSMGYLPEAGPLYPEMRVVDYLTYRSKLYGMSRSDRVAAINRVMERCWLNDVAKRRVGQLSKGYKQRVGLAGAMLHDPPVLVLDEPTSGLDPAQIRETRSLIRELSERRTVIVSSHILPEIEKTCDRVVIIARGRVRADGTPSDMLAQESRMASCLVEIEDAHAERMLSAISSIPAVESVKIDWQDRGWTSLRVRPKPDAPDLREPIGQIALSARVAVRELKRETPSLEQFYIHTIVSEDPAARATESARGGAA